MAALSFAYFKSVWNSFDFIIIVLSIVDVVLDWTVFENMDFGGLASPAIFRIAKIAKVVRLVRGLRLFRVSTIYDTSKYDLIPFNWFRIIFTKSISRFTEPLFCI